MLVHTCVKSYKNVSLFSLSVGFVVSVCLHSIINMITMMMMMMVVVMMIMIVAVALHLGGVTSTITIATAVLIIIVMTVTNKIIMTNFFSVVLLAAVTIFIIISPLITVSSEACPGSSSSSPCGSGTQCDDNNPCTPSTFSCCYDTTDDGTCYSFCAHPDSDDHPGPNWSLPALVEREVPHLSWCQTEILCLHAPVESGLTALPSHWLCLTKGNWT